MIDAVGIAVVHIVSAVSVVTCFSMTRLSVRQIAEYLRVCSVFR